MIVGVILYGIALLIDLGGVLLQKSVWELMGAPTELLSLKDIIFPLATIYQIAVMVMYAVFFLIMFRYKGSDRRTVGIVMIVVYCIVSISYPFINIADTWLTAQLKGENELVALGTLESYITMFTHPFTVVSTAFVLISIGRYSLNKSEKNDAIYEGWTTEIKEGQTK